MDILSQELRKCVKKYWMNGYKEMIRIESSPSPNVADERRYETIRTTAHKLYARFYGSNLSADVEHQIKAFRDYAREGHVKRIKSNRLGKTIILCPTGKERDMMRDANIEETIYTCEEIITLLRRGYGLDTLKKVDNVMSLLNGELA